MPLLQGKNIFCRTLEPDDLPYLYQLENNSDIWELSNTQTPFSKHVLEKYIANAHLDIYSIKQLRLIIETQNTQIGSIDLFDFDPKNNRIGVGIIIWPKKYQNNGFAYEALNLIEVYCKNTLHIHQIYCNIAQDNTSSINLFEKCGFVKTGIKINWIKTLNGYKHVYFYQKIID